MNRPPRKAKQAPALVASSVEQVDTGFLETLVGYNARRTFLVIGEVFLQRMATYDLRPVDFSVASLIMHNPGITSRQLCNTLGILPPNLVGLVNALEKRDLICRHPHPNDGRASGLYLTAAGEELMRKAEQTVSELETQAIDHLTVTERKTLLRLLKKVYQVGPTNGCDPA